MDITAQIIASILVGISTWLLGRLEKWKRWGYIAGLIAQPFFVYPLVLNEVWGLLVLTGVCTYSYGQGVYNYWIKK